MPLRMLASLIVGSATRGGSGWLASALDHVASGGGIALAGLVHPGPDGPLAGLVGRHLVRLQAPAETRTHAPGHRPWLARTDDLEAGPLCLHGPVA